MAEEERALTTSSVPTSMFSSNSSLTTVVLDERNVLKVSDAYAAVRVILSHIIQPLITYRRTDTGRIVASERPEFHILRDRPHPDMSTDSWLRTIMTHALSWGNGYAQILRSNAGDFIGFGRPFPPEFVQVSLELGEKVYRVSTSQGDVVFKDQDIIHIHNFSYDGLVGISPLRANYEAFALSYVLEKYAAAFFGNNSIPSTVVTVTKKLDAEAKRSLAQQIKRTYGGYEKSFGVIVLEDGTTIDRISVPQDEAQWSEAMEWARAKIASVYGVPVHKLGNNDNNFSNMESQNRSFVQDTLMSWWRAIESEINAKVFGVGSDVFVRFDTTDLLRGDAQSQAEFIQKMVLSGVMTRNTAAMMMDLPDLGPVGDIPLVPVNMANAETFLNQPTNTVVDVAVADRAEQRQVKASPGFFVVSDSITKLDTKPVVISDGIQRFAVIREEDDSLTLIAETDSEQEAKHLASMQIAAAQTDNVLYYVVRRIGAHNEESVYMTVAVFQSPNVIRPAKIDEDDVSATLNPTHEGTAGQATTVDVGNSGALPPTSGVGKQSPRYNILFTDVGKRIAGRQIVRVESILRKYQDDAERFEALDSFFEEHAEYIKTALRPVVDFYAAEHSNFRAEEFCQLSSKALVTRSIQDLRDAIEQDSVEEVLTEWRKNLADNIAQIETEALCQREDIATRR